MESRTAQRTVPREAEEDKREPAARAGLPERPTPTQAEANALASAIVGDRREPFEVEPLVVEESDPPTPTQQEANELKVEAAGHDADATGPVNRDVPAVMPMTAGVGDTLTVSMGNWDGEPTAYAGRWLRDGVDLAGAGTSYVVNEADAGHSITCVVTASNAIGSSEAPPSNAVAIPATPPAARAAAEKK